MDGQGCVESKKESSIDKAKNHLRIEIEKLKDSIPRFETILASVMVEPEKEDTAEPTQPSQTSLESYLYDTAREVQLTYRYIQSIQNRIQL